MPYNVIAANTYGNTAAGNFETTPFLTGGQASCLVVYVLNDGQEPAAAAMAHILSANLNKKAADGGGAVDVATCKSRLSDFWENHLRTANKGNVTFITGKNPGVSTENAIAAIKAAMANNEGAFKANVELGKAEYAVTAEDGTPVIEGVPTWSQAKNALLTGVDEPAQRTKINTVMFVGAEGNTLVENTSVTPNMSSIDIPKDDG
ncbi:hypothetical protein [Pseudovibrio ascidiaceicola]|uniref:hypothetical protein n=1 Tax=Pseudovibrio ascidiaceicola TaxID=285279 RepID=UPI000D69AC39|nr:hypothetical protein [Pseudovibrio ascidiaceicola]